MSDEESSSSEGEFDFDALTAPLREPARRLDDDEKDGGKNKIADRVQKRLALEWRGARLERDDAADDDARPLKKKAARGAPPTDVVAPIEACDPREFKTVYVSNLPTRGASSGLLAQFAREFIGAADDDGALGDVRVVVKNERAFAFVECRDGIVGRRVIEALDGAEFLGQLISARRAEPRPGVRRAVSTRVSFL